MLHEDMVKLLRIAAEVVNMRFGSSSNRPGD